MRSLDAVWLTPRLSVREEFVLSGSAGYGVSGRIANTNGLHHRIAGSLGVGYTTKLGIAFELRMDGRMDLHRVSPRDDSLVGQPRLYARYVNQLRDSLRMGLELGFLPGAADAPDLLLQASTTDILAVAELSPTPRLALIAALGPRIDFSARSVPSDLELSPSDTLSLGVSSYHALLMRAALSAELRRLRIGFEVSTDRWLGPPRAVRRGAPVRGALVLSGAVRRYPALEWVWTNALLLSPRPPFSSAREVPFEPRFSSALGVRLRARAQPIRAAQTPESKSASEEPQHEPSAAPPPPASTTGSLKVRVFDPSMQPIPDVPLTLDSVSSMRTNAHGEATFLELAPGPHQVMAECPGFSSRSMNVEVLVGTEATLRVDLAELSELGALRVLVRDAESGAAIGDRVQVTLTKLSALPARNKKPPLTLSTDYIELSPGRYRVDVAGPGYLKQRRHVQIARRNVTLLNVDLLRRQP